MGIFLGGQDFDRVSWEAGVFAQKQEDPPKIGMVGQSGTVSNVDFSLLLIIRS